MQLLVLSRFFDRRNRDFPLATFYSAVLPLITASVYLISSPYASAKLSGQASQQYLLIYAGADLLMHILLLAIMLQLTGRSLRLLKMSPSVFYAMIGVSVLVLVGASWYFYNDSKTLFQAKFSNIRRYVSVYLVILNLLWWGFLIRSKKFDRRILLLSAGIGLQMTGQVITDSLYSIGVELNKDGAIWMSLGVYIGFLTHFLCLYCWLRAFSPANASLPAEEPLCMEQSQPNLMQ